MMLFNNLFLKGYCRKEDANENEDSGDMEMMILTGTGMGEGTGIEDVSHENEGQVEGLQNDGDDDNNQQDQQHKRDKSDKDEKDNDDGGIDMSHADFDFGGELFDLDNKNEDNEDGKNERENDNIDEEDDEDDDIDCELGNFNESQQLDEQMWSAPDKKDEEKEDNKQDEKDSNEGKEDDDILNARYEWMGVLEVDNSSFLLNYAYMSGGISISMEEDKNAFKSVALVSNSEFYK